MLAFVGGIGSLSCVDCGEHFLMFDYHAADGNLAPVLPSAYIRTVACQGKMILAWNPLGQSAAFWSGGPGQSRPYPRASRLSLLHVRTSHDETCLLPDLPADV